VRDELNVDTVACAELDQRHRLYKYWKIQTVFNVRKTEVSLLVNYEMSDMQPQTGFPLSKHKDLCLFSTA
jgi:hypothetical protein